MIFATAKDDEYTQSLPHIADQQILQAIVRPGSQNEKRQIQLSTLSPSFHETHFHVSAHQIVNNPMMTETTAAPTIDRGIERFGAALVEVSVIS